jgi:hypothetical protein
MNNFDDQTDYLLAWSGWWNVRLVHFHGYCDGYYVLANDFITRWLSSCTFWKDEHMG